MCNQDTGKCSETNNYYEKITKPFEKYCRLTITNVEFKKTKKKNPTKIIVKKIEEEQALKE